MVTGADRGVLYSYGTNKSNKYTLQKKKETPLYQSNYKNRGYPCPLSGKGSLTVEAAFGGTIFFLVLFSLLFLFQILERYNEVQAELVDAVHQRECYGTKRMLFRDSHKKQYVVGWDEKKNICYVSRREEIPYLGSNFIHIVWYQQIKYNTYQGKSMVSHGEKKGEYIYLADHGRVYHRNRNCVYLKPDVRAIPYQQLENQRNVSGGKYYPCRSCAKQADSLSGRQVYITPYGDSWHMQKNCSRLKRSVRRVLIEEAGGLPPCSKCG